MRILVFLSLLVLLHPQTLWAFRFSPMSAVMSLEAGEKRLVFAIENESEAPIAVELTLRERVMLKNGQEEQPVLKKNELSVYPQQVIVPPGEKRSVRVSWSGETPKKELAYRLIAEQLPIELEEQKTPKTGIKMLMRYVAALYIRPAGTKAELKTTYLRSEGEHHLFQIENIGSHHQILTNLQMTLQQGNQSVNVPASLLKTLEGENILAQTTREFKLAKDPSLKQLSPATTIDLKIRP